MTEQEIRLAIAEACGWRCPECGNSGEKKDYSFVNSSTIILRKCCHKFILDYPNSLDAMHEAEKILDTRQQDVFAGFLGDITGGRQIDFGSTRINATTKILFATASQRAEAFLRTLNKWK